MSDYLAETIGEADSITPILAGLLTDWQFDAQEFRIPKDAFASTDLVHWLALEVADAAVAQCGGIEALPRDRTGVVVANTLTGEFSRTSQLRLRWPWLDRQLAAALDGHELDPALRQQIREGFRDRINAVLPPPNEETLAGGLANTIAGRIANYFDLHGGAWLVDAACASSLVAIANAAEQIASGRVEAMIVVGVDLSLDPFELVGFSRNGALTGQRMRVFDRRADGFWPGEGAGAVVLVSEGWARENGSTGIELAGWGLSSDGRGGLTRPEVSGQLRALREAYGRFRLDPAQLCFVEAHGTGTAVGDPTEVEALAQMLGADADRRQIPVGSVKGNIGHTKAAAGLAGLIKAAEALRAGIVPPHTGCGEPHPIFAGTGDRLSVAATVEALPSRSGPILAGVSSFGFGGINAHAVLRARPASPAAMPVAAPWSEDELFIFSADEPATLDAILSATAERAQTASIAEMRDLAADLARFAAPGRHRLAFVAGRPDELLDKARRARKVLAGEAHEDLFYGHANTAPRIGLLFPGQGAPCRVESGFWGERFGQRHCAGDIAGDPRHTRNAQPLVIGAAVSGLEFLCSLGIAAEVSLGHSLGELAALHWAGAFDGDTIIALAAARGRAMGDLPQGSMLLLACEPELARYLVEGSTAELACFNAPRETVVAGPADAIDAILRRAGQRSIAAQPLQVSHAFHSRMMAPAEPLLLDAVATAQGAAPVGRVISTVTGGALDPASDIGMLLADQLTMPVRFVEAVARFAAECDFAIEVGPGSSMTRLVQQQGLKSATLDVFSASSRTTFECLAQLHAAGCQFDLSAIFPESGFRALRSQPATLLSNPCGGTDAAGPVAPLFRHDEAADPDDGQPQAISGESCLEQLTALVAEKTGLARQSISPELRFLDDLHLNSLAVSRILAHLAQHRAIQLPGHRTAFANASLQEVADELDQIEALGPAKATERVAGVANWVRRFRPVWRDAVSGPLDLFDWKEVRLGDPVPANATAVAIRIDSWDAVRDGPSLFAAVRQASISGRHLALLHKGAPLQGFVGTLIAEGLFDSVRAVDISAWSGPLPALPNDQPSLALDQSGAVRCAAIRLEDASASGLSPELDWPKTIMVTGGARGIGAEVAIELAKRSGAALILAGRSANETPDVVATLERAAELGLRVGYAMAAVEDAEAFAAAVAPWIDRFGPPSLLVHTAGINEPASFMDLDPQRLLQTLTPKCQGLLNAIAACGSGLQRVVGFGSIIGRLGLPGEAHYALANAEQGRLLARAMSRNPDLGTLNIEWSVWSGAGMGDRLGVIDQLRADGVDAIPLGDAIEHACDLVLSQETGSVLVTSRFGSDASLPDVARLRFLDQVLVFTPQVELVVEVTLNQGRDPYLDSHVVDGVPVMPGVMLLEAIAQVAAQLCEAPDRVGEVSDVEFLAAVTVGIEGRKIRIAALRGLDGTIACEIRSDEDLFGEPVARAVMRRANAVVLDEMALEPAGARLDGLYGPLFFHGQAFRRLDRLGVLTSRRVEASLSAATSTMLFGAFEPATLLLGDAIARDCGLHLLQACVPHRRVLPVRVRRIELCDIGQVAAIRGTELWAAQGDYAFDIAFVDGEGKVIERWHEAVFRTVGPIDVETAIAAVPELIGPYLERLARETTGEEGLRCAIVVDPTLERSERRAEALDEIGLAPPLDHRGDGAPVFPSGVHCSLSHTDAATLAVRSLRPVGCDLVALHDFAEQDEASRWAASESLRKIGAIGEMRSMGDKVYRLPTGESALILSPFDVGGVPYIASIAFSSWGPA
jgi:enediyne polyketide synthase